MRTKLSFKSQVIWLSASLILLTILILTANYWLKTADYVDLQVKRQMHFAENVLNQTLINQEQVLSTSASVLAADFGFKQAVATQDKNTIESVLQNHGKRINANLMMLVDLNGNLIASSTEKQLISTDVATYIRQLQAGDVHAQILAIENLVFQVIIVPVKAPRTIAYALIGFQFDEQALKQLKDVVALDITLVHQQQVIGSSLSQDVLAVLSLEEPEQLSNNLLLSSANYYHQEITFGGSAETKAILSASLIDIHRDFQQLIVATLIAAVIVLIISVIFSTLLSKSITSPLQALLKLTQKLGEGDFQINKINKNLPSEFNALYTGFTVMSSAIEQREREIKYQAQHDLLTGLYNRHKILREITRVLAQQKDIGLININIKGFKGLNDTIGIANGDKMLVETADRLRAFCSKCHLSPALLISRSNADEFLVAIAIANTESLNRCIEIMREELERPFFIEGINIHPSFYYGLAHSLAHGRDAEKLVRRATMAASFALKEQQTLRSYNNGEDEAYLYKLNLIEELKLALDSEDSPLFLNFQPKLNLSTGKVDKLEALIRWINNNGDFVNPEEFVSLAEKSGLIVSLTQWVIKHVAAQIAMWNKSGYHFNVSINLSAQDIQHEQFVNFLLDTIAHYQLPASQIILELTERDLADNEQLVVARLTHLKSLGFEISVDDYGIGQSSLAKLKTLPVDELKIDKCFILKLEQSTADQDIVSSTIALGHKLGLRVVAEGVENEESLKLLNQFNCDYAQGYHLSRPLKADQLILWYTDYEKAS